MRHFLVLTIALAFVLGGLFPRPALTQEAWRQCDDGLPQDSDFPEAAKTCKNKLKLEPWLGTPDVVFTKTGRCVLSFAVCGGKTKCYISEVREQKEGFCDDYKAWYDRLTNRSICCDPKCEPPTPWFGSSSGCRDVQSPEITGDTDPSVKNPVVFLYICGIDVFHDVVTPEKYPNGVQAYKVRLANFVKQRVGSKVCCDKLREAVRTKKPCDPTDDIDCDGKRNTNDFYVTKFVTFPDINNLFATPEGAPVDPFPSGLNPDDPKFLPPQDKCDCKWELVKGTLTCSTDGKQPHVYQATWRCPSTGNERFTKKEAPATRSCRPEAETERSFFLVPDRKYANGFGYSFLGSLRQDRTRVLRRCGTNR